ARGPRWGSRKPPSGVAKPSGDLRRMRSSRDGSKAEPSKQASSERVDCLPNPNALEVREDDEAMPALNLLSPVLPEVRKPRRPCDRLAVVQGDGALRRSVVIGAQIVMMLKDSPCFVVDSEDFELDFWAALKTPPGEGLLRRPIDPIR